LPIDFVLMRVVVPDSPMTEYEAPGDSVAIGNAWLTEARSAVWRVPSVLVPDAWNVLLNPNHSDAARVSVSEIEPFGFDPRLWRPLAGEG
jgi:RES domain-containing protein